MEVAVDHIIGTLKDAIWTGWKIFLLSIAYIAIVMFFSWIINLDPGTFTLIGAFVFVGTGMVAQFDNLRKGGLMVFKDSTVLRNLIDEVEIQFKMIDCDKQAEVENFRKWLKEDFTKRAQQAISKFIEKLVGDALEISEGVTDSPRG